jgi:small-conductance mechanosensitive channel/CRP-like cAMP-binding protein
MTTLTVWNLMQEGANLNLAETAVRFGLLFAAYLLFCLAQRFLLRHPVFRSIGLQLNLLMLVSLMLFFLSPVLDQMSRHVRSAIQAAAIFLGVSIGLRLLDILIFERLAQWRKRSQVPLVVRDIGRMALALVALVAIVHSFFPGVDLNILAVSSLVVGYIVGNASQDTLSNLFAGLTLNAERPFQIGDWISVSGHIGVVVDTTWRATRVRTRSDDYIVIPNSVITKESVVNYSRPTGSHGCYLSIGVSYNTPPNKARTAILEVLREAPEVRQDPAPSVFLTGYGDFAINFTIKFFINDYACIDQIESNVMDRLWYAFRREGITIPYPIHEELQRNATAEDDARRIVEQDDIHHLLTGVDLFQSLSSEEIGQLVSRTKLQLFAGGERLCRQGEAGDSFYIIRSGRVAVSISDAAGKPLTVAHLGEGEFFGEMSLLTGEPRSATVSAETDVRVLCVSKQDFAGLLQVNADLTGKLAAVLEKRMAESRTLLTASATNERTPTTRSALAARIRRFFGLA